MCHSTALIKGTANAQQLAASHILATAAAAAASWTVRFLAIDWQNPADTHTASETSETDQ